jgi:hypothetical protein
MMPVSHAELKRYETETDILEPIPMEFGRQGRM